MGCITWMAVELILQDLISKYGWELDRHTKYSTMFKIRMSHLLPEGDVNSNLIVDNMGDHRRSYQVQGVGHQADSRCWSLNKVSAQRQRSSVYSIPSVLYRENTVQTSNTEQNTAQQNTGINSTIHR
jgi:hypothetical protein